VGTSRFFHRCEKQGLWRLASIPSFLQTSIVISFYLTPISSLPFRW